MAPDTAEVIEAVPSITVIRNADGTIEYASTLSAFEAPTVLRLAALSIERQLGIRE